MYKVFKTSANRFEVYEEDADGNTVQVLKPDYSSVEEANVKCFELNKPVDSVQPPADEAKDKPEGKTDEAKSEEDASKSDVESGAAGAGSENTGSQGGQEAGSGEGDEAKTGE